jgi:hypothetical protein
MIEMPTTPAPNGVEVTILDFGFLQRPQSGAPALRVDRPGSRFTVAVSYPPMKSDVARAFVARLQRAKREGLRIQMPLLEVNQGSPGSPTVNGAGQSGTTLAIDSLTPNYMFREGYWLTITEAASGDRFLHCCLSAVAANSSGQATIEIEPALRAPFADGDTIELAHPTVGGYLTDAVGWSLSVDQLVRIGGTIMIEEAA